MDMHQIKYVHYYFAGNLLEGPPLVYGNNAVRPPDRSSPKNRMRFASVQTTRLPIKSKVLTERIFLVGVL